MVSVINLARQATGLITHVIHKLLDLGRTAQWLPRAQISQKFVKRHKTVLLQIINFQNNNPCPMVTRGKDKQRSRPGMYTYYGRNDPDYRNRPPHLQTYRCGKRRGAGLNCPGRGRPSPTGPTPNRRPWHAGSFHGKPARQTRRTLSRCPDAPWRRWKSSRHPG